MNRTTGGGMDNGRVEQLAEAALQLLPGFSWPEAVRDLRGVAEEMVSTSETIFEMFPPLQDDPDYFGTVLEIMQEPKQFILELEQRAAVQAVCE